jgi:hypothetical protein
VNLAAKSVWPALVAAAVAVAPGRAQAQQAAEEALAGRHQSYQSPQHFALELRFSPYNPDIDSDPALHGSNPYATAFGTSARPLLAAEFDWQAARIPHVGTIGPGASVGYFWADRLAALAPPLVGVSGETTTLEIFPVYLVGVLRADVLWREAGIPLVPYAKLGVGVAFWRTSNTLGTSHYQGVAGVGNTTGTQVAFGLGVNLNVLDEYAARNFDEASGVNSTYFFAEWASANYSGLFQANALRVGANYWTFGLAFEF